MDRASKAALWSKRVGEYGRSGLSRRAWCDRHGVAVATLDYWRRRTRESLPMSQSFVPMVVADAPSSAGASAPGVIELEFAGVRIRADAGVDAAWLCRVLSGLR
jgi:hypothetical protein